MPVGVVPPLNAIREIIVTTRHLGLRELNAWNVAGQWAFFPQWRF
jgi:hypothetical protein